MSTMNVSVFIKADARNLERGAKRAERTMRGLQNTLRNAGHAGAAIDKPVIGAMGRMRGAMARQLAYTKSWASGIAAAYKTASAAATEAAVAQGYYGRGKKHGYKGAISESMRNQFGKNFSQTRGKLASSRADMRSAAIIGGVTLGAPVISAVAYEDKLGNISKVSGMGMANARKFGLDLLKLNRTLPLGQKYLADIAEEGARQGIYSDIYSATQGNKAQKIASGQKALGKFTEQVGKTAIAFDMKDQAGTVAGLLAAVRNQFGLTLPKLGQFSDAVNELGNKTATSQRKILRAYARGGGLVAKAGLTPEQAAAFFATPLAQGYSPERTGTMTGKLMANINTGKGKGLKKSMDKLGYSHEEYTAVRKEFGTAAAFVKLLEKVAEYETEYGQFAREKLLSGMLPEGRAVIMSYLGNIKQIKKNLGFVTEGKDYRIKQSILGSIDREVAEKLNTALMKLKRTLEAVRESATRGGWSTLDPIIKYSDQASEKMHNLSEWMEKNPKETASGMKYIGIGAGLLVGGAAIRIGLLISKMVYLTALVKGVTKGFWILGSAVARGVGTGTSAVFARTIGSMNRFKVAAEGAARGIGLINMGMIAYDAASGNFEKKTNISAQKWKESEHRAQINEPKTYLEKLATFAPGNYAKGTGAWITPEKKAQLKAEHAAQQRSHQTFMHNRYSKPTAPYTGGSDWLSMKAKVNQTPASYTGSSDWLSFSAKAKQEVKQATNQVTQEVKSSGSQTAQGIKSGGQTIIDALLSVGSAIRKMESAIGSSMSMQGSNRAITNKVNSAIGETGAATQ